MISGILPRDHFSAVAYLQRSLTGTRKERGEPENPSAQLWSCYWREQSGQRSPGDLSLTSLKDKKAKIF